MENLEQMKITGYVDEEFSKPIAAAPYLMMLNPASIKNTAGDQLNFDAVIDSTGIVDPKMVDMSKEITALQNMVFTYNGSIHRPNFVQLQWGSNQIFKGILNSFDISYTQFKPDGSPLKARITMGFQHYLAPQTESSNATHPATIVEGVSLPANCEKIPNNQKYYLQVARYNQLNKFKNLKGTGKLIFPPINPNTNGSSI